MRLGFQRNQNLLSLCLGVGKLKRTLLESAFLNWLCYLKIFLKSLLVCSDLKNKTLNGLYF